MSVSPEKFVQVWQAASCPEDAAVKCGMKRAGYASMRASRYRSMGIPLKKFSSCGKAPIDVNRLTQLAKIKVRR